MGALERRFTVRRSSLVVILQILELFSTLATLALLLVGRPLHEVLAAAGLLYLVHLGELTLEWFQARHRPDERPVKSFLVYAIPGSVLLRRVVELTVATLFVRLYLLLLILLLLVTLPVSVLDPTGVVGTRIGRLHDSIDRGVEPLLDSLLRAYNAVSLNPHPPGETGMVLAIPMPFREHLL